MVKAMKKVPSDSVILSPVSHDKHLQKKVFLRKNDVQRILQWATAALEPGVTVSEHIHKDAREVFQILDGTIEAIIEGHSCSLSAGDVLVIDPGERHSFHNKSTESCSMIYTLLEII